MQLEAWKAVDLAHDLAVFDSDRPDEVQVVFEAELGLRVARKCSAAGNE